jgi:hypothetical protein
MLRIGFMAAKRESWESWQTGSDSILRRSIDMKNVWKKSVLTGRRSEPER